MPFVLPNFNLNVNVWHGPVPNVSLPPDVVVKGNLAWGKRVNIGFGEGGATISLLLPALTDVRTPACYVGSGFDLVEVPAGTGRYYVVQNVDDIGKGFSNEHRVVTLSQAPIAYSGHAWPVPVP